MPEKCKFQSTCSEIKLDPINNLTCEQVIYLVELLRQAETEARMPLLCDLSVKYGASRDAERAVETENDVKKGEIKILTQVLTMLGQGHLINP